MLKSLTISNLSSKGRRAEDGKMKTFTAYVEWDPETNLYVGTVPGIPGAHTQAGSLDELKENLKEVLELCLEERGNKSEDIPQFVGIQQIEVPF
jgi:predicted RNase H-like HicB family nuclease